MTAGNEHIVIVNFTTTPETQDEAVTRIGDYVASFLSRQPGFIASTLHRSLDGLRIVHHARWVSEAHFRAAGALALKHPDLPLLRTWLPDGRGYAVARSFSAS